MNKILKIVEGSVFIGLDDGGLREIPLTNFSFVPEIGQVVEIFESDGKVMVFNKKPEVGETDVEIQGGKRVNKIAYVLFAVLLGGLGAHKFYVGKVGLGVLYVVFFWTCIPALIGLIEGILAAGKKADKDECIIIS